MSQKIRKAGGGATRRAPKSAIGANAAPEAMVRGKAGAPLRPWASPESNPSKSAVQHSHDPGQVKLLGAVLAPPGPDSAVKVTVQTADLGTDNKAFVHVFDQGGHVADVPLTYSKSLEGKDVFEGRVPVAELQASGFDLSKTTVQPWVLETGGAKAFWGGEKTLDLDAAVQGAARAAWVDALPRPTTLVESLGKLDELGREDQGALFQVGGQLAANQSARVTAVRHPTLGRGTEVMVQLLPEVSAALEKRLTQEGVKKAPALVDDAGYDAVERVSLVGNPKPLVVPDLSNQYPTTAFRLEAPNAYVLEFLGEAGVPKAYRGAVRLRAYGATSEARLERVREAAKRLGLEGLLDPPDASFTKKVVAQSLMGHESPPAADAVLAKLGSLSVAEVEAKAAESGVTPERLSSAQLKEVFPGHAAVVDAQLGDLYVEAGVKGVFAGIREVASVPLILSSDGLMAYTERTGRGLFRQGASNIQDERSGGARSAFTRAVTPRAFQGPGQIQHSFAAGQVQLLSTGSALRQLLSRTDWYGYPSDLYGVKIGAGEVHADPALGNHSRDAAYSKRRAGTALVEAIDRGAVSDAAQFWQFQQQNELCFDSGVAAKAWTHAVVQSENLKAALIKALKDAGLQDFNGRPFEQAIVVATTWNEVRNALVAQGVSEWAGESSSNGSGG